MADTLSIEQDAIKTITVGNIDRPLVPRQLCMVTRGQIIIQPDLVILTAPNSDHRPIECQALSLKTSIAILKPAPRSILTKDIGSLNPRLMPGRIKRSGRVRKSTFLPGYL